MRGNCRTGLGSLIVGEIGRSINRGALKALGMGLEVETTETRFDGADTNVGSRGDD